MVTTSPGSIRCLFLPAESKVGLTVFKVQEEDVDEDTLTTDTVSPEDDSRCSDSQVS